MVDFPKVSRRLVTTDQVQSTISGADVAAPYRMAAGALADMGSALGDLAARQGDYQKAVSEGLLARNKLGWTEAAGELEAQAGGNIDFFDKGMRELGRRMRSNAPKEIRDAIELGVEGERISRRERIIKIKRGEDIGTAKSAIVGSRDSLAADVARLARDGKDGTAEFAQKTAEWVRLTGVLHDTPDFDYSPEKRAQDTDRLERVVLGEALNGKIARAPSIAEARKIVDAFATDMSLDVTPAERNTIVGYGNRQIEVRNAVTKGETEQLKAASAALKAGIEVGMGLDDPAIDATIAGLQRGGAYKEAQELNDARAIARENLGSNAEQLGLLTGGVVGSRGAAATGSSAGQFDEIAPRIMGDLMRDFGLTKEQAAGIVGGNLGHESGEFQHMQEIDPIGGGTGGWGWAQWTGPRRQAFFDFAEKNGLDPSSYEANYRFMTEGESGEWSKALAAIAGPRTAEGVMVAFEQQYERAGVKNYPSRRALTARALQAFGEGGGPPTVARAGPTASPAVVKARLEENKRDLEQQWPDVLAGFDNHVPFTAEELAPLLQRIALLQDPDDRDEKLDELIAYQDGYAFSDVPEAQAEAMIAATREGVNAGEIPAMLGRQALEQQEKFAAATTAGLNKSVLGWADRTGVVNVDPLDFSNPEALATGLQARNRAAMTASQFFQRPGVGAMLPAELEAFTGSFMQAPSDEQAGLLGAMNRSLSPEVYNATLAEIAKKPGMEVVSAAGALYEDQPQVAEALLRGQAILAENPKFAPSLERDDKRIDVDDMLPPTSFQSPGGEQARQGILKAATAFYADGSFRAGDATGVLNYPRFREALNAVTGGIIEGKQGEKIIAPRYGMTQEEFNRIKLPQEGPMSAHTPDGRVFTWQDFHRIGVLRNYGDGLYNVATGDGPNDVLLKGRDEEAFVLHLDRLATEGREMERERPIQQPRGRMR